MISFELAIGFSAGFFTTIAFAPQAFKTMMTQDTRGISLLMYLLFVTGVLLWIAYGVLQSDLAIIVANVLVFLLAFPILCIVWKNYFKNNKNIE